MSGRLDYVEWTADEGSKRSKHEVIASRVDFLAPPAGGQGASASSSSAPSAAGPADDGGQPTAAPARNAVAEIPF